LEEIYKSEMIKPSSEELLYEEKFITAMVIQIADNEGIL